MTESLVRIAEDQQITDGDLRAIGEFTREGLDHVVKDGIEPGMKFTGFPIVQSGPAQITIGEGRLYSGGAVFARYDEGGVVIDLINSLPAATDKIVSIVAFGKAEDTSLEPRTFLVDVDTEQTEARATPTRNVRYAFLNAVSGVEAADPKAPAVDANVLVIANVRLSPSGISSIVVVSENRLDSVRSVSDRTKLLESWRARAGSRLDLLDTNIAGIQDRLRGLASSRTVSQIARDVARLKEISELPETFSSYDADRYLTADKSDTGNPAWLARIEEGIKFPPAHERIAQIGTLNPNDPLVRKQNEFILPAYTEVARSALAGADGELQISSYQYQTQAYRQLSRTRTRIRYGVSMTVCTNSAWWQAGTYDMTAQILTRNGETWAVELVDASRPGHVFYRVTQYFVDTYEEPYWGYTTVPGVVSGSCVAETFLNSEPGYITAVGLYFSRKAATGTVTLLICDTDGGAPNIEKVVASSTIDVDAIKVGGEMTKIPIEPTYLEKGHRYAIVPVSPGNHYLATVSGNANPNGSLFTSTDGAWFQGDLVNDLPFSLFYAAFNASRVEVQLGALQLENGIANIDLNIDSQTPAGTEIRFEAQLNGVWQELGAATSNLLIGLPPLLPFRAVMLGTVDVMPGIGVGGKSEVVTWRPRSDFKHISTARVLPSVCDEVEVNVRLEYWQAAKHTCTIKLLTGENFDVVVAATTVSDAETPDPAAIVRKAYFDLSATPVGSYKIQIEGATNNVVEVFHVAERYDLAFN